MPGPIAGSAAAPAGAAGTDAAASLPPSCPLPASPPPRYVALAGLLLRWYGHFTEVVPAGVAADRERVRVRKVEVRLHLVVS